jgi:hypothetical protein
MVALIAACPTGPPEHLSGDYVPLPPGAESADPAGPTRVPVAASMVDCAVIGRGPTAVPVLRHLLYMCIDGLLASPFVNSCWLKEPLSIYQVIACGTAVIYHLLFS